ncbi:MAG: multidrug efflux RND transporter permease subunit [Nevskiaceae bacterium]|nr:MAG: multidrug efflux RND transporter permease subunit [Nevskiaceae bacterium]
MNLSAPFIRRPVATTLLTLGIVLSGVMAFRLLPVAPLPQVDFPTVSVQATLPGASPETMASAVATPLERQLGRIAGVTEMTSSSSQNSTRITLQFDLDRDIDGAARDVQAAINAARNQLPSGMPGNPTYRKVNPAAAPVMILTLTSATLSRGQMYDAASTILAQKISQVKGVGQVQVGGSSLPAVRVELNPNALNHYGIGLDQVRNVIAATNANRPKGSLSDDTRHWQLYTNDQARTADDYRPLVIKTDNGTIVRIADVGEVSDSVEDLRNLGLADGKPSVLLIITQQPGANILETIDRINALLPELRASIPAAIDLKVALERTATIRGSLHDVERTLVISVLLVILVVFVFLRDARATLIPTIAVPVSLIGTFGVMYLCGYSLDNLSLMALTVATGFVVDDAIVVLENVSRHMEAGMPRRQAALQGAREVGFTVLSMSLSLVAVFIPILLMGGIVGRLFREFAVTLSVAILVSLLVALTTTPMMCAHLLREHPPARHGRLYRASERVFNALLSFYEDTLRWALRHGRLMMLLLLGTIAFNVYLYAIVPKGFFPQQDTGRLQGGVRADQSISFQAMRDKMTEFVRIVRADPDVDNVVGFTGGGQRNGGNIFVALKPYPQRRVTADQVIARLRPKLAKVPGASLFLQAAQDIRVGGRAGNAQYQYTLQSDDLNELRTWTPKLTEALRTSKVVADVDSDQQDGGLETFVSIDRDAAARLGITPQAIDSALNDAFGQRQVSTIYNALNQYHVVMEVAPDFWQSPETLKSVYVRSSSGAMVPLTAFSSIGPATGPLAVNHQGEFAATTLSFNLQADKSLSAAVDDIRQTMDRIGVPASVHGSFQGTAKVFQESLASQPLLILAAFIAIYIVLGMLYESYVHPLTILSTLPSAGVGAILALLACNNEFNIIALIGVILLIGIVKKNAIMMIDFALDAQRAQGLSPEQAIFAACLKRFRPIMMTTAAALLGALPLALGTGNGAEICRPLGISIVGGLLVSQALTLYTTPVVYLYLDRFRQWCARRWAQHFGGTPPHPITDASA